MEEKHNPLALENLKVSFHRFDDDNAIEHGDSYHGFAYEVWGEGIKLWFKKYDDDTEIGYVSEPVFEKEQIEPLIKQILNDKTVTVHSLHNIK